MTTKPEFRRVPDVIAKLEADRAQLIEALRMDAQWFKQNRARYVGGSAEPDQQREYINAILRSLGEA